MTRPPLPKEHGSWAMFGVPLIIGLAAAPFWQWRALFLIAAAFGLFLVRFPLAMIVKTRKRPTADRAGLVRWSIGYAALAALGGGWLIVIERLYWLIPIGLLGVSIALLHLWLVARKQEMSAFGELIGIGGLALGAPLAYYTASGQLDGTAAALWVVNALYFGGTVFYIKLKVRQQPRVPAPDQLADRLVKASACLTYQAVVLTIVILLVAFDHMPLLLPLAFVPMTLKVLYGATRWQDKRSLSLPRLGLIELIHAALFAVIVIAAF